MTYTVVLTEAEPRFTFRYLVTTPVRWCACPCGEVEGNTCHECGELIQ
jgi:hypothetical protein